MDHGIKEPGKRSTTGSNWNNSSVTAEVLLRFNIK